MKVRTPACVRYEGEKVSIMKARTSVYANKKLRTHTHGIYINVNYNFQKQTTFHIILLHIIFDQILVCKLFIVHFIIFKCINYVMTLNVSSPYIIWLS